MNKGQIAQEMIDFLKDKVGPNNVVTSRGEGQLVINCSGEKIKEPDLKGWIAEFLREKKIVAREDEYGFSCRDFLVTITDLDLNAKPPFIVLIGITNE